MAKHTSRLITPRTHSGFTLFELLVVIAIISVSFAVFLTINFSFGVPEDNIRKEANRLHLLLSFAHEQSVIRAEEYGVRFSPHSYSFMQYEAEADNWTELDDKVLTTKQLANDMELALSIEQVEIVLDDAPVATDIDQPEDKIKPQIFLLSSGETTPDFIARIGIPGIDTSYEVHGTIDGKYALNKSE
ncbi:MAG: type II secretion system minor pseudopilin GspH [Gammaproteobacteria bacterium]|nr:type II secretion system minor pseudopilin GspH [Gammaproteobacteria bacterium]